MQIEIDATRLTVKKMRALENAKTFGLMAEWFSQNCAVSEEEIDALTLPELMQVAAEVKTKISVAMSLPKVSGGN